MTPMCQPTEPDFVLHPDTGEARANAERLFDRIAADLRVALPASADIRHIGATAISGCLTKGDLDIVVRVPANNFVAADEALAARFARNAGSGRSASFSSFDDASTSPHLGIQLAVAGSDNDVFHLFAEALTRNSELVARYNALKRDHVGQPMEVYRAAKDAFIRQVLDQAGR